MKRLDQRRILITGAASGIGRATALLFAREGACLALLDRDLAALRDVAERTGGHPIEADVSDEAAVERAVQAAVTQLGGLDGIVNSAGIQTRGSLLEGTIEDWHRSLAINLTGPFLVIRAALPWLLKAESASVVNLGSGQSLLPNAPNRSAYAASKGGLLNLSRALAAELAPRVRVNTVCPGLVDTPMAQGVQGNVGNYALRRMAQPDEIARAILFLTSTESSYVTGAALAVDGGRSFH
ncbi:SDR family oxidoreductase [Verticiella sediminum]|uniref:SDR family oxidoreductase n=1 Tax=Verticiella sediminum TaxID=1247510 RepID=A0A556AUW4_9BURK|nr:SDR family oxidoreductase [Verticiella sediminum]TSH96738.1 SDR family oxidoreductase [Verticiella sediminum]